MDRQTVDQLSSFFPSKRDKYNEEQNYLRMQRNGVALQPLNFPVTRSILWNRTAQGDTETLHLTTKRNVRLYINEKTLHLARRHANQNKSSSECFLVGSVSVDSKEDSIDVTVDRFDPGREVMIKQGTGKVKRKVPTTVVPGDHIVPITVQFGRISSQETVSLSHLVSLKVCCQSHGDDDEIIINVNCGAIAMGTKICATPVVAVPIIPTALARNLSGPLRLSEVQGVPKCGYLTMDHTRKLLLLLESDPKAVSLPLLGMVFAPPDSFLLLLYSPVKSTPEFWECRQDQPLGSSSTEPLCFELFPAPEGLGRSLFEQAVNDWEKEQRTMRFGGDEDLSSRNQPVPPMWKGPEEEEFTPVPRPSPSPHPQNFQLVLPEVAKTSLSLSFDEQATVDTPEQGFAYQKILPNPKHMHHPKSQSQQDQENNHTNRISSAGLLKAKNPATKNSRAVKSSDTQNSPSREPLRPILAPNQTQSRVLKQKQIHPQLPQKSKLSQGMVQSVSTQRVTSAVHHAHQRPQHALPDTATDKSKRDGKQVFSKQVDVVQKIELGKVKHTDSTNHFMVAKPKGSKSADKENLHSFTGQCKVSPKHKAEGNKETKFDLPSIRPADNSNNPTSVHQIQKPCLETVYEGETLDGTLNQSMGETELQLQIKEESSPTHGNFSLFSCHSQKGTSCANNEFLREGNTGLVVDEYEGTVPGNVQEQRSINFHSPDSGEQVFKDFTSGSVSSEIVPLQSQEKGGQTSEANEENPDIQKHQQLFKEDVQVVGNVTTKKRMESSMSAEGSPLPDPYQLLMRQEAQLRELQEQIKLLLQQQNAQLLPAPNALLTPPRSPHLESCYGNNRSPDPSPISMVTACTNTGASLLLGTPVKLNSKRSAATSPIKEKDLNQNRRALSTSSEFVSEMNLQAGQPNSKQLHRSTNPDELANQVIEIDDPSQTLASSLHAVDIPSFVDSPSGVTSPSSNACTEGGGMETSLTSPMLGQEDHTPEDSSQKSDLKEPATPYYATREEVVMATVGELEKLKASPPGTKDGPTENHVSTFPKQWPFHRSASLSIIPDHPRINYLSLSVDDTLDEVFSEADFKYLTDDQQQELQKINSHGKSHSRQRAVTFDNDISRSPMDYTWNNLSMATQQYLGKYCLAPKHPDGLTKARKTKGISSSDSGLLNSETFQGCKAPPPTPEPTSKEENTSNILDITRLKKLPKLI
ncbi:SCL-interrupting locus protein [Stylophora pistillata]|uniref:SCL-interrupting locus protein n=1 Tax=Stylophora pistillata TaxID=50429 RepID=A0A2B4RSC5_STYPI|nr:SCL-interrupting locus protein [Stylophora pistillata]